MTEAEQIELLKDAIAEVLKFKGGSRVEGEWAVRIVTPFYLLVLTKDELIVRDFRDKDRLGTYKVGDKKGFKFGEDVRGLIKEK